MSRMFLLFAYLLVAFATASDYVTITSGTCSERALLNIMSVTECREAAIETGMTSNNAINPYEQSENDRPHGCRRQTFGSPLWINNKPNSPTMASTTHTVVCKVSPGYEEMFTGGCVGGTAVWDSTSLAFNSPSECYQHAISEGYTWFTFGTDENGYNHCALYRDTCSSGDDRDWLTTYRIPEAFVQGPKTGCPPGYAQPKSAEHCKLVAQASNVRYWGGAGHSSSADPRGCIYRTPDKDIYFNTHIRGSTSRNDRRTVCVKVDSEITSDRKL